VNSTSVGNGTLPTRTSGANLSRFLRRPIPHRVTALPHISRVVSLIWRRTGRHTDGRVTLTAQGSQLARTGGCDLCARASCVCLHLGATECTSRQSLGGISRDHRVFVANRGCIILTASSRQIPPDLVDSMDGAEVWAADAGCARYETAVGRVRRDK
jgi:hypothetical protein